MINFLDRLLITLFSGIKGGTNHHYIVIVMQTN